MSSRRRINQATLTHIKTFIFIIIIIICVKVYGRYDYILHTCVHVVDALRVCMYYILYELHIIYVYYITCVHDMYHNINTDFML